MKKETILTSIMFVCITAAQAVPSKEEAKQALTKLRNAALCGYTVLEADGTTSARSYIKMRNTNIYRLAIKSQDVFLKGTDRDDRRPLYTKSLDSLDILFQYDQKENESSPIYDANIDYAFPEGATKWILRKESEDGKTCYFLDFFRDENSIQSAKLGLYRPDLNPMTKELGSIELELYRCGRKITKNLGNRYFRFAEVQRVFDDEIEIMVQSFSNVDIPAECDILEAYFRTKRQTKKIQAALARVQDIRACYKQFLSDEQDGFEGVPQYESGISLVSYNAWLLNPNWQDKEGKRNRKQMKNGDTDNGAGIRE